MGNHVNKKYALFFDRMSLPSTFNRILHYKLYKSLLIKNPLSSINGFDAWLDAILCRDELSTKTVNYLRPYLLWLLRIKKLENTEFLKQKRS